MHSSSRIDGIQYLRGIAAILVIFTHCNAMMAFPEYFGSELAPAFHAGSYGVQFFFAISGFIITLTSLNADLTPKRTIGDFAWNRFIRIIPLMWVCILGYNLLSYLGTGAVEWGPLLRAMVLWPVGDLKPNVIWTLRHEALFYAVFAIAMLGGKQRIWLLIGWFLSPLVWQAMWTGGMDMGSIGNELATLTFNAANLHFGVGFLVAAMWLQFGKLHNVFTLTFPIVATLGTACALLAWFLVGQPSQWPVNFLVSAFLSAALLAVVLLPVRSSKLGLFLGDASYSIYLVHNAVLLICLEAASRVQILLEWQWAMLPAFVFSAVVGGSAVHIFVERPLLGMLRRRAKPAVIV